MLKGEGEKSRPGWTTDNNNNNKTLNLRGFPKPTLTSHSWIPMQVLLLWQLYKGTFLPMMTLGLIYYTAFRSPGIIQVVNWGERGYSASPLCAKISHTSFIESHEPETVLLSHLRARRCSTLARSHFPEQYYLLEEDHYLSWSTRRSAARDGGGAKWGAKWRPSYLPSNRAGIFRGSLNISHLPCSWGESSTSCILSPAGILHQVWDS